MAGFTGALPQNHGGFVSDGMPNNLETTYPRVVGVQASDEEKGRGEDAGHAANR